MTPGNNGRVSLRAHLLVSSALGIVIVTLTGCGSTGGTLPHGASTAVTVLANDDCE